MLPVSHFCSLIVSFAFIAAARPVFSGDFALSNLVVYSPFQTNATSISNTTISFSFSDQDLPDMDPVRCSISWPVGVSPPSASRPGDCEQSAVGVWFPQETYHGIKNFTIALSHSYADDTIGKAPYNYLTKFAELNLTYPSTSNYECGDTEPLCTSCVGTTIIATVTRAVA